MSQPKIPLREMARVAVTPELLQKLLRQPVNAEQSRRAQLPKCPFCRQRPTFFVDKTRTKLVETGVVPGEVIAVPFYSVLPCCSVRYVKVHNDNEQRTPYRRSQSGSGGQTGS